MGDAVPKPPRSLPVQSGPLPTKREILELANQASYVFGLPEAAGLREQLRRHIEVYLDWLRYQQHLKGEAESAKLEIDETGRTRLGVKVRMLQPVPDPELLAFLLLLLFSCPQILSRPSGFEWVGDELERRLLSRRLDLTSDDVFWKAMDQVRRRFRSGRPSSKALDYFRYNAIYEVMNRTVVVPGVLLKRLRKTKAVEYVAAMESRLFESKGDTRSIWRSYKRAEQFLRQLNARMQATASLAPPQTREVVQPAKKTSNRSRRSPRQKRVKRK